MQICAANLKGGCQKITPGAKRCALQGHDNTVTAAFAPDGGRVLTASVNTAQLWDRDGKPLATLKGHTDFVVSAVFVPDGNSILTASERQHRGRDFSEVLKLIDNVKTEVPRCLINYSANASFSNRQRIGAQPCVSGPTVAR